MLQGKIEGHTEIFGPPKDWDHTKEGRLPKIYVRKGYFGKRASLTSSFYPTPAEIDAISKGAPVHLTLLSALQPPSRITVGETPDATPTFPNATKVLSLAAKGEPKGVVVVFDRPPTEDEVDRLKLFLCR